MSEAAFTPGPWHASVLKRRVLIQDGDGWREIAAIGKSEAENAYDLILIAAAPDLYEALRPFAREDVSLHGVHMSLTPRHFWAARAALAKARGEA